MKDLKILGVDAATKTRLLTLADGMPLATWLRQHSAELLSKKEEEERNNRLREVRGSLERTYNAQYWAKLKNITNGKLREQDLDTITLSLALTSSIAVGGYGEGAVLDESHDVEVKSLMREFCLEYVPKWCRKAVMKAIEEA